MAEWLQDSPENLKTLRDRYPLVVRFHFGGDLLGGKDWADLCDEVIPGYCDRADDDATGQLVERVIYAVKVQTHHQAIINSSVDLSGVSAEDLAVLEGDRVEQPEVTVWTCPVPLIVVDGVDYEPWGSKPRPVGIPEGHRSGAGGNLVWLDATNDADLFRSMAHALVIELFESAGPDPHAD